VIQNVSIDRKHQTHKLRHKKSKDSFKSTELPRTSEVEQIKSTNETHSISQTCAHLFLRQLLLGRRT
jgi:hypothetical protein